MTNKVHPAVLLILDGWGLSDKEEHNAIFTARTPVWDRLWKEYPHAAINTSGSSVGLPSGQMGNSEVGHLNLGSGRVVYQEFTRVSRSIRTGSFFKNRTLTDAVDLTLEKNHALHIFGLLSPGGVHSHEAHIHAMVELGTQRGVKKIYVHAFLDGRDMPPKSAMSSLKAMQAKFDELGVGQFASIVGRYYAMDRNHRWERVQQAYELITEGRAEFEAPDAVAALQMAYDRGESDEFVKATRIVPAGSEPIQVETGDVLISMNYRSDRARQITRAFIEDDFDGFKRKVAPRLGAFVSLTEYNKKFDIPVAFPAERLDNVFGEYISKLGLHQLRLAETEKYAHVTFFFNGGLEEPFEGEDRILIPSPDVATYDLKPEMSAPEVTDNLVDAIGSGKYDVIIVNYANGDMVGHSGIFEASVQAVETLDECLGRVLRALHKADGAMLVTADHGNVEQMEDYETGDAYTAHTCNPVPLIYVGSKSGELVAGGALCDMAPTLLQIMELPQPPEMTGHGLLKFRQAEEAGN
jgi:2,3-bisphosphoglycerate-independent phosphoglycerate mutase